MQKNISIIIPVYNVAQYLPCCLKSVTSQTFMDIEIILVDDGSTDGSAEICDVWAKKDQRIKVFHKSNGGVSTARNIGLAKASGAFIGFVDADDIIEPEMYERLIKGIGNADMISCGYIEYPLGSLEVRKLNGIRATDPVDPVTAAVFIYERDGYSVSLCNKLFRKEICNKDNEVILFREELACGEDEVWLSEVLGNCKKIAFIPEALYHWMPRIGSVTREDHISDKRMSVFSSKALAMKNLPQDERVQMLVKARMYNDCYFLKAQAYYLGDKKNYDIISKAINPLKKKWAQSNDPTVFKRIKVMIMEVEMTLHFPRTIVKMTDSIRRNGIKVT